MKTFLMFFLTLLLSAGCLFTSACGLSNTDEPPVYEGELGPSENIKPIITVLEVQKMKNSFYQPVVKARFKTTTIPDKVIFSYQNVDTELNIDSVIYKNGYVFYAEQNINYGKLKGGEFEYVLTAYYGDDAEVCQQGTITIDEDYFVANTVDGGWYLDKESNWIGPF